MPIAKYALLNLTIPAPPPIIVPDAPTGGSGIMDEEEHEEYLRSFAVQWDETQAFEASVVAWELGDSQYKSGKQVSFDQFAWKAYENIPDDRNHMRDVIIGIDASREVTRRERIIRIAKTSAMIGGVTYVVWRLALLL